MATIDGAYSIEFDDVITATFAKELFEEGVISDQRAFECCGEGCTAQITCCNMTKPYKKMKRGVHFVVYGKHSDGCSEILGSEKINRRQHNRNINEDPVVGNVFKFSEKRPHKADTHQNTILQNETEEKERKNKIKRNYLKNPNSIKRSICNLNVLVPEYLRAKKENELEIKKIELQLNSGKIINYTFREFFCRISKTNLLTPEYYHFCYFGKAFLSKYFGGYKIIFTDHFLNQNETMEIQCIITEEIIEQKIQRNRIIMMLDSMLGREIYCFLFGTRKTKNENIYININSLDHIACTDEDIDSNEGIE